VEERSSSSEEKNKEEKVLKVKSYLMCPVTLQLFNQPVCIYPSGITIEKDAADHASNTDKLCPVSRKPIIGYSENLVIKEMLNEYLTQYPKAKEKQYVLGTYGKKHSNESSGYTGPVKPSAVSPKDSRKVEPSAPPLSNDKSEEKPKLPLFNDQMTFEQKLVLAQQRGAEANRLCDEALAAIERGEFRAAVEMLHRVLCEIGCDRAERIMLDCAAKNIYSADVEDFEGSPNDLFCRGMQAFYAVGVKCNQVLAVRYFSRAADLEHSGAQHYLGMTYQVAWGGVKQDDNTAARWYERSAKQGYAVGQSNSGFMSEQGRGTPQNLARAVELFAAGAESGCAFAQNNLATMYHNGRGVPKNSAKAREWYTLAAAQGDKHAKDFLESHPELDASLGVDVLVRRAKNYYDAKNYEQAVSLFRLAADKGDAEAQNYLGYMYACGLGVPKDAEVAVRWYRAAAEQGDTLARNNLGHALLHGKGVPQDYVEAARLFHLAVRSRSKGSIANLNYMYQKNLIVFDPREKEVYRSDLDLGVSEARVYVTRIEELETLDAKLLSLAAGNLEEFKRTLSDIRAMLNQYELSTEIQTAYLQAFITKISVLEMSDEIKSYIISWAKISKVNTDVLQEGYAELQQSRFETVSKQLTSASSIDEILMSIDQLCGFMGNHAEEAYDKILRAAEKYLSLVNDTIVDSTRERKMLDALNVIPFSEKERYKSAELIIVQIFQKKAEQLFPREKLLSNCVTVQQMIDVVDKFVTQLKQKQSKFKSMFSQDPAIQRGSELQRQLCGLDRTALAVVPSSPPRDMNDNPAPVNVKNDNNAVIAQPAPSAPPLSAEREVELELPSVPTHLVVIEEEPEAAPENAEKRIGLTG
jgi:TPR repeat protein